MEKVSVRKEETFLKSLEIKAKEIDKRVLHVEDQNKILSRNLRKVFTIWDNFFKTIAVIFSIVIAVGVTSATRSLYYLNGKWDFSVVFIGSVIFFGVLGASIWALWSIINSMLTRKINNVMLNGGNEE